MNKYLLLGIVLAVILIGLAAYFITQSPAAPSPTQSPATTAPTQATPTTTPPATTPSPTPPTTAPSPTPAPTTTATPTQTHPATPTPTTTTPPQAAQVTIRIWHALNPEEEAVFKEVAALYMQQHPNVKIVFENKAPDLQTAVLAAIAPPYSEKFDLFIWAHDWIGLMVEAGALKPVENDVQDVLNKFVVSIPQYKGHIYGLPFTAETVALICNKKMAPQPPTTFADLLNVMKSFNKPPQTYGISYVVNPYFISAWIHGTGGYYFDDKTEKQGLTDPRTIAGFQFFKTYIMPYVAPNPTDYNTQVSLFLSGQTPCMVNGPWSIGAVKKAGIDFYVVPLPPVNSTYVPRPYGGLKMFYVTIYASPKEAIDFMKWFTTDPQVAKILVDKLGYVPVIKDVNIADPVVQGFYDAVKNAYLMPVSPKMQPVWGAVDLVIQNSIVSNQKTIAQAVQDAVKDLCARGVC